MVLYDQEEYLQCGCPSGRRRGTTSRDRSARRRGLTTDDDRTPVTVEFDEEQYTWLTAMAAARGITLDALLGEIIDAELRRLRRQERDRH